MMYELHRVAGKKACRRAIRALKPQLRRLCLVTGPGALIADEAEVAFDDSEFEQGELTDWSKARAAA
eukprot:scaffold25421_cov71-Phaeocystis_antarctica.AAC.7